MNDTEIKTLIDQTDLVSYVEKFTELTKSGSQYRGVCPICQHDNDSEFVVYNHRTFHCWACGAAGDVINFIREKDSVDFYTAAETLARDMNVEITKDKKYIETKTKTQNFQQRAEKCHANVRVVSDYLHKARGLLDETIDRFMLGADEHGNVTIPFVDENGRYCGGAVRRFEGTPKYLTNKNIDGVFTKSKFLYNLRNAKKNLTNTLFMVEGFFCAMSLDQNGLAAVAYNSSQPTDGHFQKIASMLDVYQGLSVVIVPDNDAVAMNNLPSVRNRANKNAHKVAFEVMYLPDGIKDINEFFTAGHTLEEFVALPKDTLDLAALKVKLDKCGSVEAERKMVDGFAKTIEDELTLLDIAKYLAQRWDIDMQTARDYLKISQVSEGLLEDFKDPETCLAEAVRMLREPAVSYGISTLDEGINGAGRRKDVTFIGGYSSSGKTFLTICMACDMVVRQRKKVIYFSMEMSAGALYARVIACLLQKPSDVVNQMILDGDILVWNCLEKLKQYLYVVDKNGLTIEQVDRYVKEAKAKLFDGDLDCVFIDYIQYMKNCAQFDVLAETAKGMKPLAKNNEIHVVVLSQLNRGSRIWEKPSMADLKGGGDLEASADNILLLWRPEADPSLPPDEKALKKGCVMLGIGKARNGAKIDEVELFLNQNTSRIERRE